MLVYLSLSLPHMHSHNVSFLLGTSGVLSDGAVSLYGPSVLAVCQLLFQPASSPWHWRQRKTAGGGICMRREFIAETVKLCLYAD